MNLCLSSLISSRSSGAVSSSVGFRSFSSVSRKLLLEAGIECLLIGVRLRLRSGVLRLRSGVRLRLRSGVRLRLRSGVFVCALGYDFVNAVGRQRRRRGSGAAKAVSFRRLLSFSWTTPSFSSSFVERSKKNSLYLPPFGASCPGNITSNARHRTVASGVVSSSAPFTTLILMRMSSSKSQPNQAAESGCRIRLPNHAVESSCRL